MQMVFRSALVTISLIIVMQPYPKTTFHFIKCTVYDITSFDSKSVQVVVVVVEINVEVV